ncbi:MAG: metallophosphoesterase [Candidatus Nanohaloarchaeota archaeon QJJ-9]|nr:metallophosphoesterase [Candidatus Nanohaloarchaeota archaeon QJJ-9]
MDIAVISDLHLGYGWNSERQSDSFKNAKEAFEKAEDADIVLMPGDIFDKKVPKQEVFSKAVELFKSFSRDASDVEVEKGGEKLDFRGKPIIAIHGTHERRSSDYVNPVELLEKLGFLAHLHNEKAVCIKGGEKLAVYGMSGVPERYAPKVLERFDPQPVEDAFNILMLHQSIENFVYTDDSQPSLKLEQLPTGYDYIIDGHIHWKNLKLEEGEKPLVFPGSTITTQRNKVESEKSKGFLWIDSLDSLSFEKLDTPRSVYNIEIDVSGFSGREIRQEFKERMEEVINDEERKPLVRVKLEGETDAEVSVKELKDIFEDEAILSLSKNFSGEGFATGSLVEDGSEAIEDIGSELLKDKLGFGKSKELFELLSEDKVDKTLEELEKMDKKDIEDGLAEKDETSVDADSGKTEGSGLNAFVDKND